MKHSYLYGVFALMLFIGLSAGTAAHADVASTTATSTVVMATTTVATTTATTTPVVATTTVTSTSHIADLMAQLAKLLAIFNDLKAKLMGVQAQIAEVKAGLHEGSTGDEVKAIQDALASDPSIYPSGLKTGFFGPLTVDAIKKFQAKNGLEVTGEINAETKAALDTIMVQRHSEGHFPMGLLIAPGQHRDEFEHRLRAQCVVATTTATTTVATPAAGCMPFMQKYHMEGQNAEHGTTTTGKTFPPRPMPGQGWSNSSSSHGQSEQEHGGGSSNH